MDGDAEILGRGRWLEGPGGWADDEPWVPPPSAASARGGGRRWDELLDEVLDDRRFGTPGRAPWLTQVVLVGDRVVDVVRRPAMGSEYECEALDQQYRTAPPPPPPPPPRAPGHELQLAWLATLVGGVEALAALDAVPLPADEELHVGDAVPTRLRTHALELELRFREPARRLLGPEGLTAARRLLARLVATTPGALTRGDRDDVTAAAVVWAAGKANDLMGSGRPVTARALQDEFGLRSAPASRGAALAQALGGGPGAYRWNGYHGPQSPDVVPLGDPALLTGRFRRRLVLARDLALGLRARTEAG